jgi:antirestriction protein ArdC
MQNDIAQQVTDRIIAELEAGAAPWVKPWKPDSSADKSIVSGKPYQGINRLLLAMSSMAGGFSSPYWATFKQWKERGAHVKKGSTGTQIIFYSPIEKTVTDQVTGEAEQVSYAVLKSFYVFNADQVEGAEIPTAAPVSTVFESHDAAEAFIAGTGARISHGGDAAFYVPSQDRIQLPHKSSFTDPASYYATAFHELTHWTGHESRTDRKLSGKFASPSYAFEELVAELGAAFLCQDHGISGELRHAGYIGSWLKACREDKRAIFRAAGLAQKAVDFMQSAQKAQTLKVAA